MRKNYFSILFVLLTACSGGGGEETVGPALVEPTPCLGCRPVTGLMWGSAPCQERGDCEIQLLNVSKARLEGFYNRNFKDEMSFPENPEYHCGRHLSLQLEGSFNEVDFTKEDNKIHFLRLSSLALDPTKCMIRRPIEDAIDIFFNDLPASAIR